MSCIEPGHSIFYKIACAPCDDSDQHARIASAQADQRFRCPPDDVLDPSLPTQGPAKAPIRLRVCAG